MPDFIKNFRQKSDGWFDWETQTPILRDARVRYTLNPDCCGIEEVDEDNDTISVVALCEFENGVTAIHERTWNFIVANRPEIERQLRRKLWAACLRNYQDFIFNLNVNDEVWLRIKEAENWETIGALDSQIELIGINLLDHGFDEIGFSLFDFSVGWDEEHGASLLMHRDRILAASGLADFTNRGQSLIPHARSIQAYDFTQGDLKLDESKFD